MKLIKPVGFLLAFSLTFALPSAHAQTYDQCYEVHIAGKYSESEVCWRKLTEHNPSDATLYYYLGQALRKQTQELGDQDDEQKLEDAINAYRQAIRLSQNDYAWAWNGLANAFHRQKNSDEAAEAYRQSINASNQPGPPTNAHTVAHCNLANELESQGRHLERTGRLSDRKSAEQKFTEAISETRKGINLDSQFGSCWVEWGDILSAQEQYEAAIEKYRQAEILEPQNAYLYVMWGRALGSLGQLDEAMIKYRQAIQVNNREALRVYAWAYVEWGAALWHQTKYRDQASQQGKVNDAIDKYQRALKSPIDNEAPTWHGFAHNGLGLIYWQYFRDLERAKLEFAAAIEPESYLDFPQNNYKEVERLLDLQAGKQLLPIQSTQYLPVNEQTPTKRSVVRVVTRFWSRGVEFGTGWVMRRQDDKAWIMTNRHIIANSSQDGDEIQIELYYGNVPDNLTPSRLSARILSKTLPTDSIDLAIIEVDFSDVPGDVQSLSMSAGNTTNNTAVSVIGNTDFLWSNAFLREASSSELVLEPLLRNGNSGSPVLSAQNQVVGLVHTSDPDPTVGRYSYAHPINLIAEKIAQWKIFNP